MKLRISQLLGYTAGDAANNLAFSMASMFLLLYYTDVVGISAAAAGTIFLVVRIWDGIGDLIAGRLVDITPQTRWGKFRPWILLVSPVLLLLTVATFSVPDLGPAWTLVYAYATYAAFAMAYSLVNIPYGSLTAAMTQEPAERGKLGSARSMGAAATIMMLAFVVSPQVESADNLQRTLTTTLLVFVVIGLALYLFTFFTARENVERSITHVSFRQSLTALRQNRPLIMLCLSALSFLTAMFALQTIGIYYARDVLGNANLFIPITIGQIGMLFLAAPLAPMIIRKVGKLRGYIAGGVFGIVGGIGVFFAPASVPAVAIGFFFVIGIGLGLVNTLMWALEADTVEYGEWNTGVRTEGANYAIFSFTRKCGQAVGGAAAAYTIGLAGYVAGAEAQSAGALLGIRAAAGVVPVAFFLLAILIMLKYPLTERRFAEITADVSERRESAGDEKPESTRATQEA